MVEFAVAVPTVVRSGDGLGTFLWRWRVRSHWAARIGARPASGCWSHPAHFEARSLGYS
jgi:hypothetical protein